MLCDDCGKNQATVRLVAVIDGNKTERHLCPACMQKHKLQMRAEGVQSMLSAIWSGVNRTIVKHPGLACPCCGLAYDEFVKTSRLGCAQCYEAFRAQLRPMLVRLHGRGQHAGRVPERADDSHKAGSRMEQLRREMDVAIACEDFEQAAVLRDELRALAAAWKGAGSDA